MSMEVELQNPGGLQRVLRVSVPAERFDNAVDKRLRQLGTRAKVPGFRPVSYTHLTLPTICSV